MNYKNKIFNSANASCLKKIKAWKEKENIIVFTNGCFDIIHAGHVEYLHEAKKLGHKLIVGLNSDASVKRLKGDTRPVNSQLFRAEVLAFMGDIDMVVIFNEDTPYELISTIMPDVLVKGGDWKADQIVGSDLVLGKGGIVRSLKFREGFSTTSIIERIHGN
ncbi:MAG: D-glycero-beta-D-manno-heptose 1-phosphate adenylyltransferase [Deltaproteobacteria bacterium]